MRFTATLQAEDGSMRTVEFDSIFDAMGVLEREVTHVIALDGERLVPGTLGRVKTADEVPPS